MNTFKRRVAELEQKDRPKLAPCVSILRYEGQSEAEAVAAHEVKHGSLGPDDGRTLRVIIHKPFPAPQDA
jgi:hypothetical protein